MANAIASGMVGRNISALHKVTGVEGFGYPRGVDLARR
jgi:hypothetical protein